MEKLKKSCVSGKRQNTDKNNFDRRSKKGT